MGSKALNREKLLRVLKERGSMSVQQLTHELGIGRTSLFRLVSGATDPIVRLGQTSATRYAMLRDIPTLGSTVPIYQVTEEGKLEAKAKFLVLYASNYAVDSTGKIYQGLPPEIFDMYPQGFLGRGFARQHARELGLPERLDEWSADHILIAIGKRGEDTPGNLILGKESADRWQRVRPRVTERAEYPLLAEQAMAGQPQGFSAGGEQPKFTAYVNGRHCLVKFAGGEDSPAQARWRDLLICEELALSLLSENKIEAARARAFSQDQMTFLEVERFDRIGERGRKAVLTLAAIDNYYYGSRGTWSSVAEKLEKSHLISKEDSRKVRLIDAFGLLIGDTDRHFHNLAFFPQQGFGEPITKEKYSLTPVFDKLPMLFAPVSGRLVPRTYQFPIPDAPMFEVWNEAVSLAKVYWARVYEDNRISSEFRALSADVLDIIKMQSN